jgi:hypothetical protein
MLAWAFSKRFALRTAAREPRDSTPLPRARKLGKLPAMRLASSRNVLTLFGFFALCSVLAGCPEKGGPAEKTTAEPERAEPDDEGKGAEAKRPAATAPAPAPAPAADDKKPDDDKDKGGW